MAKKKLLNKEFYIGLSVIVAVLMLILGIDYLKGINLFKPANFYIASYQNVSGLEVSAPVTVNGFKVGQVREINFDFQKPGKIQVVLALDKDLHLPQGSQAVIASTLLSGAYIDIQLGSGKDMIPVGSEIATSVTPDLMASVSQELMPDVSRVLHHVDTLLLNLNTLVADPALAQSIGRLDGITGDLLATTGGLRSTVLTDVPRIMTGARGVLVNVDTVSNNLAELSRQLRQLPLRPTMDNVHQITANLSAFSDQLRNPNSSLGLLMNDPELYNRFNRVAADVDSLIVDIKRNPKRYISIKLL